MASCLMRSLTETYWRVCDMSATIISTIPLTLGKTSRPRRVPREVVFPAENTMEDSTAEALVIAVEDKIGILDAYTHGESTTRVNVRTRPLRGGHVQIDVSVYVEVVPPKHMSLETASQTEINYIERRIRNKVTKLLDRSVSIDSSVDLGEVEATIATYVIVVHNATVSISAHDYDTNALRVRGTVTLNVRQMRGDE